MKQSTITDLSYLRSLSEFDDQFVDEMVNTFLEQTPVLLQRIGKLAKEEKWLDVGRAAHQLKPSIIFMGMKYAEELVRELEHACRESDSPAKLNQLIENLGVECSTAFTELKK